MSGHKASELQQGRCIGSAAPELRLAPVMFAGVKGLSWKLAPSLRLPLLFSAARARQELTATHTHATRHTRLRFQKHKQTSLGATSAGATTAEQAGKPGVHCGRTWAHQRGRALWRKPLRRGSLGSRGTLRRALPVHRPAPSAASECQPRSSPEPHARHLLHPPASKGQKVPASVPSELRSP